MINKCGQYSSSTMIMLNDIKQDIVNLLSKKPYGLTIAEVSQILKINRSTASKYLLALHAEKSISIRNIGRAKLHSLKNNGRRRI